MSQGTLPLSRPSLGHHIASWLYLMWRGGVNVRAIKLSIGEFMRVRATFPDIYEKGYIRLLCIRQGRKIVRDVRIQLVKEPRWTS